MDRGTTTGAGAPASFTATAARVLGDLAPLEPVRASAGAMPPDLLDALAAASTAFSAVLATTPSAATATDGVVTLGVGGWAARAASGAGPWEQLLLGSGRSAPPA